MAKRAFSRREHKKRNRLGDVWRKPKGLHSKVRKKQKQYGKMPTSKMRTDIRKRFMHPLGMLEIRVHNLKELNNAPKNSVIRLASGIGGRKKVLIFEAAKKLGVRIIGAKDIDAKISKIHEEVKNRQKITQEAAAKRERRHKAAEEKAKKEKDTKVQEPKANEQSSGRERQNNVSGEVVRKSRKPNKKEVEQQ